MNAVKINRKELLEIVRNNKEKHVSEFKEAVEDFKAAAVKVAKENLKLANSGDLEKIRMIKPCPGRPTSYEASYSRAIRMLELSVEDTIEVEEYVFNQLVLDEWDWKNQFVATASSYKTI